MPEQTNAGSTLLRYDLTTDSFPLQASPETGNLIAAQLTVVAWNPIPSTPVMLQGLIISLPVGTDSTDLTPDATGIGPVPPAGWKLDNTNQPTGKVSYTFYPDKEKGQVKGGRLSFVFNNVVLNRQPGTVAIEVMEGSGGCTPPDCPTQQLFITKFPSGWGQVQVWTNPDPPILPHDGGVTINWAGPPKATYSIEYFTTREGIVQVPAEGQPALSNKGQYPSVDDPPLQLEQTTTFYLSVEENISGQSYRAQQQVTATVEVFKPIINRFTGEFSWANNSVDLVLKWDTQNAATCRMTGDPHLLIPSSLDDSYLITPGVKKPLPHTYTLTTENGVGDTLSTLALQWGETVAGAQMGGNGIAVSSDDSYLYLMGGQYGPVSKFALASVLTGAQQPVATYQAQTVNFDAGYYLDSPIGLALSADNKLLFVANGSGGIVVINAGTLQFITSTAPGFKPTAITCARDGSRIYVAGNLEGWGGGIVTFVLTSNGFYLELNEPSMTRMVYTPPNQPDGLYYTPVGLAISPSDGRIFAAHNIGDLGYSAVTVWEPSADPNIPLQQVGTLSGVQFIPRGIAFSLDGTRIFVTGDGNQLHIYDHATLQPTGQPVTLDIGATAIASTFDGARLLVSDGQALSLIIPSGFTGGVGG